MDTPISAGPSVCLVSSLLFRKMVAQKPGRDYDCASDHPYLLEA